MPKRVLRLDIEEYNHIIQNRYLAKKRKISIQGFG